MRSRALVWPVEPLVLPTWALVVVTIALVAATAALAYFTRSLVKGTSRLAESSERLEQQNATQFRLSGPLPRVAFPQIAKWERDLVSPGKPWHLWIRFSIRNEGRSATTIAGAYVKLLNTDWKNGMPLTIDNGLPIDVAPGGNTGQLVGYCTIWPDDVRRLAAGKKALVHAFTPSGSETEAAEVHIYPPNEESSDGG